MKNFKRSLNLMLLTLFALPICTVQARQSVRRGPAPVQRPSAPTYVPKQPVMPIYVPPVKEEVIIDEQVLTPVRGGQTFGERAQKWKQAGMEYFAPVAQKGKMIGSKLTPAAIKTRYNAYMTYRACNAAGNCTQEQAKAGIRARNDLIGAGVLVVGTGVVAAGGTKYAMERPTLANAKRKFGVKISDFDKGLNNIAVNDAGSEDFLKSVTNNFFKDAPPEVINAAIWLAQKRGFTGLVSKLKNLKTAPQDLEEQTPITLSFYLNKYDIQPDMPEATYLGWVFSSTSDNSAANAIENYKNISGKNKKMQFLAIASEILKDNQPNFQKAREKIDKALQDLEKIPSNVNAIENVVTSWSTLNQPAKDFLLQVFNAPNNEKALEKARTARSIFEERGNIRVGVLQGIIDIFNKKKYPLTKMMRIKDEDK